MVVYQQKTGQITLAAFSDYNGTEAECIVTEVIEPAGKYLYRSK